MLRAGGYRRVAGRAARSLDVSNGVDAIYLPTNFFVLDHPLQRPSGWLVPPRFRTVCATSRGQPPVVSAVVRFRARPVRLATVDDRAAARTGR